MDKLNPLAAQTGRQKSAIMFIKLQIARLPAMVSYLKTIQQLIYYNQVL